MTIRELRKITGLSQSAFALKYKLNIRQVQSWEQGWRTVPESVMSMLEQNVKREYIPEATDMIKIVDINRLKEYPYHRNCYDVAKAYIEDDSIRVCAFYGLRRTGKTVLMSQIAKELTDNGHKCLFLVCSCDKHNKIYPKMKDFLDILDTAAKNNYEYVFVDEMTYIKEIQGQGAVLSDYYGLQGLKIVATGTDSLNYSLAADNMLYDRIKLIHTSYVSFEEYNRLLDKSLDDYISYGGTLREESPYKDKEFMEKYTNTAIVENIIHSLENSENVNASPALTELYDNGIIISSINRCINQMNQHFTMKALTRMYESAPLHTGINNAASFFPYARYIDIEAVDATLKKILSITDNIPVAMKPEHLSAIKEYLKELDLFKVIPSYKSLKNMTGKEDVELIMQPGMMYCHAAELCKVLMKSPIWNENCGSDIKALFRERVDRQVKGCILENMIIAGFYNKLDKKDYYVSKLSVDIKPPETDDKSKMSDVMITDPENEKHMISERVYGNKEADMIITEKNTGKTYLFEVKYSENMEESHTKNLRNTEFLRYVENNFGDINGRYVLYNGASGCIKDDNGLIYFINASDLLKKLSELQNGLQDFLKGMETEKASCSYSFIKDCPFESYNDIDNWRIHEESLVQSRYAEKMKHLNRLWNNGFGAESEVITLEEYTTRKKIVSSELEDDKMYINKKYDTYKPMINDKSIEKENDLTKPIQRS